MWYVGAGLTTARHLHADHLGSIVAATNSAAAPTINAYDEYGVPKSGNAGRFQYTGQAWLSELGLYHYKARMYSATLGRFLQTDPVGYTGGVNLYAYVANDPLNFSDPEGLYLCQAGSEKQCDAVDAGVRETKREAANLPWQERLAVNRSVDAFGARGTNNGVIVFKNDQREPMRTATESSHITLVSVSDKITSSQQLVGAGSSPAGNVVHEGSHIYDGRHALGGRNWETYTPKERLWLERRAYTLEGKMDRALGWSGRGADPLWKPGMTPYEMKINAYKDAWQSAQCGPTPSPCGDPYGD